MKTDKTEKSFLQKKIEDYNRFFMTLMIVSTYAYLGVLIHYFIKPIENGNWLLPILLVSLSGAALILRLLHIWNANPDNQID